MSAARCCRFPLSFSILSVYCLIAPLIAVVMIAGVTTLGTNLNSKYNAVATKVASQATISV